MEILDNSGGDFHIKLHIRNKSDNFIWSLVSVYGAAQDAFKPAFLRELVNLAKDNPHPIIIGGILTCSDFHMRRVRADLIITGHFYSMLSSTVWT
jgi:hypothetical protein